MRKSWILNQDGSLFKSKNLGLDTSKGLLSRAINVLIPFHGSKCAYIGVDGEYLHTLDFSHAEIRYQLQAVNTAIYPCATGLERYSSVIFDYFATTVKADSIESFYNNLHNLACLYYLQYLEESSEDDLELQFLDVAMLDIRIYGKNGSIVQSFHFQKDAEEIPFEMSGLEILVRSIGKDFGMMQKDYSEMLPFILIKEVDGKKVWMKVRGKFELYSYIEKVFAPNSVWSSYIMATDDEYDFLLSLQNATAWLTIIDLGMPTKITRNRLEMLTITAFFNVPRFVFSDRSTDDAISEVAELWNTLIDQVVLVSEYDTPSIMALIEYLPYLMKFLAECSKCKAFYESTDNVSEETIIDVVDQTYRWTVVGQIAVDVNSIIPTDVMLTITTDLWQDHPVTIKDVAKVLSSAEDNHST